MIAISTFAIQSCKEEDKCKDVTCPNGQVCVDGTCLGATTNIVVSDNIAANTTWTNDNVYELAGRISVLSGATLTIEAGTVIKGRPGAGVNATCLLVARGGKLIAEGTASLPIIFTSVADEITPADVAAGNLASPNLTPDQQGLWGGLIVLGNAPISASASQVQIEGIPTTDPNGLYGGTDVTDNSGVLKYISIRHGGANIGNGNEINGLTLGGVGNGTLVENIEIIGNQDDGVEFFGGSVNARNIVVLFSGDDAIDTDQAWSGTLDNFIVICGLATDHALEIDGPEGTNNIAGHVIKNGSILGDSLSELADFRSCAIGTFENLFFFGFYNPTFPTTLGNPRGDFSLSNPSTTNTCTTDNFSSNNTLIFNNLQYDATISGVTSSTLSTVFRNTTDTRASLATIQNSTVGADKSKFSNWSWVAKAGRLDSFK